ncbi:hypothetical protein JOD17_003344 [Geomicrobium sediminis]|uniref:Uncharacterized protein n=2 Tax=Geomicrobium sediminis TaxID=1347788 RepID=A0ABS2PG62_9BACL|nr:hypothetical protein [Geomicrobium sediminis]
MNKEDAMSIIERLQEEKKAHVAIDRMTLIAKEIQQKGFGEFVTDVGFILKDPKKPFLWLCCKNGSMVYFEDRFFLLHATSMAIQIKREQVKVYWSNGDQLFKEVDPFKGFVRVTWNSN